MPLSREADDHRTIELYTELVQKYGDDVRALNWGSQQSQQRRFRVLTEAGPIAGATILDVGCGTGDLYGWLRQTGWEGQYTGIDITPAMVELARQRFSGAEFRVSDLLHDNSTMVYDFVFASGIFTYRISDGPAYLQDVVARMFERCRRAVAFNSLSSWASVPEEAEFYADPLQTVASCRKLSQRVVLRHDYHPHDFTVYLYRSSE